MIFDHELCRTFSFQNIPLNEEIVLMDEQWMEEMDEALLKMFEGGPFPIVGYISRAIARSVGEQSIEVSWYPNVFDRFHEVRISLPRDQFIACVDCWQYGVDPHVFVKRGWLKQLHLRSYSVFALIDAVGVKQALINGNLQREKLVALRDRIDRLAESNKSISFISFADSLLLKSNWRMGHYDSPVKYTYAPEDIVKLVPKINDIYVEVLGLSTYAVLTQGSNEYYDDSLLHISTGQNHISLNSIGLPFAQLMAIEHAARQSIRSGQHGPAELYMDSNFYKSLDFSMGFKDSEQPNYQYDAPMMSTPGVYYMGSFANILQGLRHRPV